MKLHTLTGRTKTLLMIVVLVAYVGAFLPLQRTIGYSTGALALVPVAVVGIFFGMKAGLLAGLLALPVNTILLNIAGHPGWDAAIRLGGAPGHSILIVLGGLIGRMRDMQNRLQRQIVIRRNTEETLRRQIQKNRQLLDAEQRRAHEAETLRDAAAQLTATRTVDQVLKGILVQLERVVPYDSACVFLKDGEYFRAVAGRGFPNADAVIGHRYPADGPLSRIIRRTQRPFILDDASVDPRYECWGDTEYVRGWMAIPLVLRGDVVGQMTVDSREVGAYGENDAKVVRAFANQVAIALENARLHEETQNRLREVTLLSRIIALTSTADDLPGALQQICTELARFFDVPQAACALLDEEGTTAEVVAEYRAPGRPRAQGSTFPVDGNPSMEYVLEHKLPLAITDVATDPRVPAPVRQILRHRGTVSLLLIPMLTGDEVVGTLGIDAIERREFRETDVEVVQHVAHQAGQVLERLRLFTAAREHSERMRKLAEASESLNHPFAVDGVLAAIGEGTLLLSGVARAAVYVRTSDTTATCAWSLGLSDHYIHQVVTRANKLPGGRLWQSTDPVLISDVTRLPKDSLLYALAASEGFRAAALWPLVYEDRTVAAASCYYDEPHTWSDAAREVMEAFARQAAIALENARLYEKALHQALTDGLTELYNSRYFYTQLASELERSRRREYPCSLLMIDLDNFKQYNDDYGHIAGDEFLRELARLIRTVLRQTDTPARYGGEEFAIILPETKYLEALEVAERLRIVVQNHTFAAHDVEKTGRMTVSIGVATFPIDASDRKQLVHAADQALLWAKRDKNRVCGTAEAQQNPNRPSPP